VIAAVIPAGGAGRRMGGVDKAVLTVGGVRLLDRVLTPSREVCHRLVVVGPARPTSVAGVEFVQERRPGGGPVPAVAAALEHLPACDVAVVLAGDLPFLGVDHLRALLDALPAAAAGAVAGPDHRGRPNPLLAAYGAAALRSRAAALGPGAPASRLLPGGATTLDLGPSATFNVNSRADHEAANLLAGQSGELIDVAQWLRGLVATARPGLAESVEPGRQRFSYRHPDAGPVCAVLPGPDGVRLCFEPGTGLPDPHGLLCDGGREMRYVELRDRGDVPPDQLVAMVGAAVELGRA
jgi:molybdopterin-guanine dinucleotide biosynthesis protein A